VANAQELESWLNSIPAVEQITSEQFDGLMNQCQTNSPLWALLALLLGQQQDQLRLLSQMPLGTAEKSAAASVIQGHIRGLDAARQTLLSLAKQAAEAQPANEGR
jgi:hypothetical protein